MKKVEKMENMEKQEQQSMETTVKSAKKPFGIPWPDFIQPFVQAAVYTNGKQKSKHCSHNYFSQQACYWAESGKIGQQYRAYHQKLAN